MSFEVNLWRKRKIFKDFIQVVSEKIRYDIEYSKGMKKIYDMNCIVISEGSLNAAFNYTRDYFMSLHNYYNELTNYVKTEVLDPSKVLLEKQNNEGKKLYADIRKLDKDFRDILTNLEKLKIKFLTSAKIAEEAKLDSELARVSYIPQAEKEKFFIKSNQTLKEAKEAEKNYINCLQQANLVRQHYIDGCKAILHDYQILEQDFFDSCKDILRKFFIFENSMLKSSVYDSEKAYLKIEESDPKLDIKNFIESNDTNLSPPLEIEYVPYSISMRNHTIEDSKYPSEVFYNVVVTIQSTFEKVANDYYDPVEEKKKIQIYELSKLACHGDIFSDQELNLLVELLKEKKYRLFFLSHLNRYRSNGIFEMRKTSYDLIGDVLIQILDHVLVDKDYESARYAIILSQTYHYFTEEGLKVSLQDKIERHEVLKNMSFWENFIAYSIYEEIEKQNNSDISESEEDKNSRIANIVFSQLLPITDNMLSFEVNKDNIKSCIISFSKQYNIAEELNQHILTMVDEKEYTDKKIPEAENSLNNLQIEEKIQTDTEILNN